MRPVILASTSPYRAQALHRLGLHFRQEAPLCDEEALKAHRNDPQDLASYLAQEKARSVAREYPQAIVIGSDQLAFANGVILGKPGSAQAACEQLQALSGKRHCLLTALHVCSPEGEQQHLDCTTLHMRHLDTAAIERYVRHDNPIDCAGAYKIEAAGISLFSSIESQDHSAITGLPMIALVSMLMHLGISIPST
ncbi:MAG: septum formation protein Maf [Planctomycetota bacterium]|nr:MAG: septum formation protein Maf [Planctomycetota bacterium]